MIFRTPQHQIDAYYQNTSINQTALKTIIGSGMLSFLANQQKLAEQEETYEEKDHFIIGGAVDCYLTQGEECFLSKYHFSSVKKPGDGVLVLVKELYERNAHHVDKYPRLDDPFYRFQIYELANKNKFYMNRAKPSAKDLEANEKLPEDHPKYVTWESDKRWELVYQQGQTYFEDLIAAQGKQVLSDEQNATVNSILNTLTTHPHTAWLFQDAPDTDTVYQLPIYTDIDDVYCKMLLDMVKINHKAKRVMPIDAKTHGGYITSFNKAMKFRRYDVQGDFYSVGLKMGLSILSEVIGKDVRDYTISNFAFVAESTTSPKTPLIFVLSDEVLAGGRSGFVDEMGVNYLGWEQGLQMYKMWNNANFELENLVLQTNGVVKVGKNFKYNLTF